MKTSKVRYQLFLPKELGARVSRIAEATGRPRSEVLVEALEAFLNRRTPGPNEEALGARLAGIERRIEAARRTLGLQWEIFARLLRHQLVMAAALPRADAATQASAAKEFESIMDEIADRLAGKEVPLSADPGIAKAQKLH